MPFQKGETTARKPKQVSHEAIERISNASIVAKSQDYTLEEITDMTARGITPHYVYIRVPKGREKRATSIRFQPLTWHDKDGKVIREHFPLVDQNGIPTDVITMTTAELKLDINTEYGKLLYANAKNQPAMYLDRLSNPLYTLTDEEEESETVIDEMDLIIEAGTYVKGLNDTELLNFSRLFGINPDTKSVRRVRSEMLEKVHKDPKNVIKMYEDPNKDLRQIFRKAVHRHIIVSKNGVFYWGDALLGETADKAINWMIQNEDLVNVISEQADAKK